MHNEINELTGFKRVCCIYGCVFKIISETASDVEQAYVMIDRPMFWKVYAATLTMERSTVEQQSIRFTNFSGSSHYMANRRFRYCN